MNRFPNPYQAQTPIGQALQNVAQMFFSAESPRAAEERQAITDTRRAQRMAYEAAARESDADALKRRAEADEQERANSARFNFFPLAAQTVMPDNPVAAENFISGAPVLAFEGGVQPRPAGLSAGDEAYLRRAQRAAPLIAAGGGDAEKLAQAFGLLQDQGFKDQVADGSMAPTRFFQTQGKAPFDVKDHTLVNVVEGIMGPVTQPGQSEISLNAAKARTEGAQAGAYGASARAADALASLRNAERENEVSGRQGRGGGRGGAPKMQWVLDENGQIVLMDQSDIAGNPGRYRPTNASVANPKGGRVDKNAAAAIEAAIPGALAAALGTEDAPDLDAPVMAQLRALTERFYTDPNSAGFQSPAAAARLAAEEAKGAFSVKSGLFGGQRIVPASGVAIPVPPPRSSAPTVRTPPTAAPAPSPTPAIPPAALDFYRKNRGAPGVREQFIQKYGFDPEGQV